MDYLNLRRQTLARNLKNDDGMDALLVTNPVNVTYLTGFTGDGSYLVASDKKYILVTDARFEQQVKEECEGIDVHVRPHSKTIAEAAGEVLTKAGTKSVGLEADHATLGATDALQQAAPKVTFAAAKTRVESQRVIKDPSEIEQIRAAVRAAERAFSMFKATIREQDTEKDLVNAMEGYIRRSGARGAAFPPIVAVGERGALPHAPPTDRALGEGSKLLVDWGADMLYKSDITRTFKSPFGTAPTRRNKHERVGFDFDKVYDVVAAAHDAAVAAVRDGAAAKDVDAAARKVIAAAKFGDYFTHGLGHGIGLEIHEAPRIRSNSTDVLESGMVITIEPAIYIPDWGGIRIEDDYLVTKDGATRLTTLPRDPGAIG
ncbi:M24 family metallopeptidase [Fimbriiglobus ruber]|uniref:Aminopeptidase YpdF (MP-, MA-, MS-, AP-, NP-specific) n=1 Tax=Fimbriiglobus ruber TaxID=1908690 RepID=A0A225DP00_9BACT|nr:Xaa-Pro peptidase family protein [Fimbriiglobus ruber]OWK40308.1 Aminopeptidase YpdF (MP-, MA-, MS-, AP-, NP- specific) [Fimbriiglobus ruber]